MSAEAVPEPIEEKWNTIREFPEYKVSNWGRILHFRTGRIMTQSQNQYGVVHVGMMRDGLQQRRSVPLLVATAFIPRKYPAFDTPINLDGDRWNNHAFNLLWRPRWFAIEYVRQFKHPPARGITHALQDVKTGLISENSWACAKEYGLLEEDLIESIENRTYVWPTYQQFRVLSLE